MRFVKSCLLVLLLFLFFSTNIYQQNLTKSEAEKFISGFLAMDESLQDFINEEQLDDVNRLGINYENVRYKFLIGLELDQETIKRIQTKETIYSIEIDNPEKNKSILKLKLSSRSEPLEFFFENGKFVSRAGFYAENWKIIESKFVRYYFENEKLVNDYCVNKLDQFIENTAEKLGFDSEELDKLEEEKIDYYLCSYVPKVKELTGFEARGMYSLAFDQIISIYNCHYHELVHLLVNFKLQFLPLYTHPFFQEGLAVALGGRGGKDPDVIFGMGSFLIKSGFGSIDYMLTKKDFLDFNASFTYPISGLYNNFLLKEMPMENYLKLYIKYSGDGQTVNQMTIATDDLGDTEKWLKYVDGTNFTHIKPYFETIDEKYEDIVFESENTSIKENDDHYLFASGDTVLISSDEMLENYISKEFKFNFPSKEYKSEKYLIITEEEEISVYNLFTNNLIAKYAKSISEERSPVTSVNGRYLFIIDKDVFDEDLSECGFK